MLKIDSSERKRKFVPPVVIAICNVDMHLYFDRFVGKVKFEWVVQVIQGDNEQTIIIRQKEELAGYLNYAFPDILNIKGSY